ncbi:ATP-dependent zinc metalloprotease FtsH [Aggregatilinea sp.]|jgi:cell division protease FtsH|uniref:ATP-dependent zinc metalloprotease FtsH n=1 Tax=Aggregatilinea sp. TaxID=2806333 RepID=UPI0032C246B9
MFVYILIIAAIAAIVFGVRNNSASSKELTVSQLVHDINNQRVNSISVSDDGELTVMYDGNETRTAQINSNVDNVFDLLESAGADPNILQNDIEVEFTKPSNLFNWIGLIGTFLPLLLIGGFIYLMLRQAQGSNNQALSFGKSRARMFTGDQPTVTFEDVAGADEAKEELQEVVEFLKDPERFIQLGARIPKGVLLVGSPGTGKTLLAKAVSGEAGVPFFSISGSEFVEMFVGVGASRVRDLFEQAKRHSPCIIFVDEIDAVGRHRGAGLGGSHDEREQTLNQILVEMDGFDTDTNVIIMAATNRPDILDPALLRPGRFDRRVVLDRPDMRGREAILKVHSRGKPLASDVDLTVLAKTTPGFVGADLENLVNEAAIVAARKNKKSISMRDFEEAVERVVLGPERRSRIITEEEKRLIAYHEAGHAVVFHMLPNCDPVRKVTIVARGMAGGVTWTMPENDTALGTTKRYYDQIAGTLGGRAAEEIVFGDITNGASSDLENVTRIARTMITRWGMSTKLGPRVFGQKEELVFLGREIGEQRDYSESIAEQIDEEVHDIVATAYERALTTLRDNRDKLDALAERLMEVETIGREDFLRLMGEDEPPQASQPPTEHRSTPSSRPNVEGNEADDRAPGSLGPMPSPA